MCSSESHVSFGEKRERVREGSLEEVGFELDFGKRDRNFLRLGPQAPGGRRKEKLRMDQWTEPRFGPGFS